MSLDKLKSCRELYRDYKEFPCDLCGSRSTIELPYARKYTNGQVIHICKKCGLIYVKMRRPYNKIAEVWSKELFGKKYTAKSPLMVARHAYVAEFLNQHLKLKNKEVCDIGAGEGQFLKVIKQTYGASVYGIEPSLSNCNILKRLKFQYFNGTLEDFLNSRSYTKYQADIVTMMWTLENATSCRDMLMGARKILKEDGYLFIGTGSRILVNFSKPLRLYLSSNPVDTHPVRFSFNTLVSMLAATGFKTVCHNSYLNDNLLLGIIAKKCRIAKNIQIQGDDFRKVRDFFKKWHNQDEM